MSISRSAGQEREDRLHAVIADYLDREAVGAAPPRAAWLAEHAELAAELRQFLEEHERLGRLGAPLRALAPAANAVTLAGSAGDTHVAEHSSRSFGAYALLREIARGGMGIVYEARHRELDRVVALKMILAGQLASRAEVDRFRLEAHAAANLDHPHIVPIYEVGEHAGHHFFTMKFIEGQNLAGAIADCRLPIADLQRAAARLMAQVARAVHYAHQRGILHRDLKPANILMHEPGSKSAICNLRAGVPLVTDFGLAKRVGSDAGVTHSGAVLGTPSYMAPEQATGSKQLTTAVDVYSLGAILYECLTGRPPFRGESPLEVMRQVTDREPAPPRSLQPALERDLETVCLKCLDKDPARRYASAEALALDLERWLAGEPIEARPSTAWERTVKWARRRPAAAALAAVVLLSTAALLGGGLFFNAQLQFALDQVTRQQHDLDAAQQDLRQAEQGLHAAQAATAQQQLEAQKARGHAEDLLSEAASLRLVARSEVVRSTEPTLALLLALEASRREPRGLDHNNALAAALQACRETGPVLTMADGHDVRFVRWFKDGKRALTISWDTVRIWDAASGRKRVEFDGPKLHISSFALSPDEAWLALTFERYYEHNHVAHGDGQQRKGFILTEQVARVYDTTSGKEVCVLRGHQHRVAAATFSPDSKRIVTASADRTARIWDAASGKLLRTLQGHECGLADARFLPDGRVLTVSGGERRSDLKNPLHSVLERWPAELVDPPLPGPFRSLGGGMSWSSSSGPWQGEDLFACLWDADTGTRVTELRGPRMAPKQKRAFPQGTLLSPDGRHLLGLHETRPSLWDLATGKEVFSWEFGRLSHTLPRAAFSQDGKRLALVFAGRVVHIYDVETRQESATLRGHGGEIHSVCFSPDETGRRVLTAAADGTARVWDSASGTELFVLRGHEQDVRAAEFHRDGERVLTGSDDGTARLWNIGAHMDYARNIDVDTRAWWSDNNFGGVPRPQRKAIWSAALSPDGKRIAAGYYDGTLRIWDRATGAMLAAGKGYQHVEPAAARDQLAGEVFGSAWNRAGDRVLIVTGDRIGTVVAARMFEPNAKGERLPFHPVRIHDGVTGASVATLDGHVAGVRFARFSPDGSRVLTIPDHDHPDRFYVDAQGAPRGQGSGGSTDDRTVRLFDAATGKQLHVLEGNWKELHNACWDAQGERICTVHENYTIERGRWKDLPMLRIWDARTGAQTQELLAARGLCNSAQFSPDGRRLLTWFDSHIRAGSSSTDAAVRVWDLTSGKPLFNLADTSIGHAAYSPDGHWIVTTSWQYSQSSSGPGRHGRLRDNYDKDRTVRIWNAANGALHAILYGHTQSVHYAAFSHDSRRLVTCSEDRTARVWDVGSGKEVITLRGHEDAVKTAEFSSDGQSVLTVSWDGSARLWPVDPLPLAQQRRPRELTDDERGRFEIEAAADRPKR